jgi:hypothetical protein
MQCDTFMSVLLPQLLPNGGLVAIFAGSSTLTAYFDESDGSGRLPITSVGGYLFEPDQYNAFDAKLKALCKDIGIEFFRTTDCLHGSGQFARFGPGHPICERAERAAISLIREHAILGVGGAVSEATFNLLVPVAGLPLLFNTPYSMLCNWCLAEIGRWANGVNFHGKIAYLFESGNDHQSEANTSMDWASKQPILREHYRYANHGFVCKKELRGLQAADMLAYFSRREGEDRETEQRTGEWKRPRRKDFQALIGFSNDEVGLIKHQLKLFNADNLKEAFSRFCDPAAKWWV